MLLGLVWPTVFVGIGEISPAFTLSSKTEEVAVHEEIIFLFIRGCETIVLYTGESPFFA